jgi:hypothetical protein
MLINFVTYADAVNYVDSTTCGLSGTDFDAVARAAWNAWDPNSSAEASWEPGPDDIVGRDNPAARAVEAAIVHEMKRLGLL